MNKETKMNEEVLECGIEILRQQVQNFIKLIYFEEIKADADVEYINWLLNRILKTWSTVFVIENRKDYVNEEELNNAITEKNNEYIYTFAKFLPKPVVKMEKLKWKQTNTDKKN